MGGFGGSLAGPVGTIGGSAAGASAGELIRQWLQNKNDPGNVLKEGAIGGVGGGIGEVLGPLLRGGASILGKTVPKALDTTGTKLIGSQYNLNRQAASALKLPDTIDNLAKYGITNVNDIPAKTDTVVKILGGNIEKAVSQAGLVDTTGVTKLAEDIASNAAINPGNDQKFIKFIDKGLQSMYGGPEGSIATGADPAKTFKFVQTLEKMAADLTRGKADHVIPAGDKALSNGYKQVANELKARLFGGETAAGEVIPGAGADNFVANSLMPEEIAQLEKIHPQLAADVNAANTAGSRRHIMESFIKGKQAADITESGANLGFKNINETGQGIGKIVPSLSDPGAPIRAFLSSRFANAGAGGLLKGAANIADKASSIAIPDVVSRAGGQVAGQAIAQPIGNSIGQPTQASGIPSPLSTDLASAQAPNQMDQTRHAIGLLLLTKAKSASDVKAALDLMNPQGKALTAQQQRDKANAQVGIQAIHTIRQQIANNPNIMLQAAIPGSPGARIYQAAKTQAVDIITRLRTGAALNKDEQKTYDKLVPAPFDSAETIDYKLATLEQYYNQFANGQQPAASDTSSVPSPYGADTTDYSQQ